MTDISRRTFLKLGGAAAAGTVATVAVPGAAGAAENAEVGRVTLPYPHKVLAKGAELKVNVPVSFHYPDAASPCTLVKLGRPVPGGVGPDRDIVAYSSLCTHMGCPVTYDTATRTFRCPCHYSTFDAEMGGQMVCGQATEDLPRIVLKHDAKTDTVTAIAVEGLIYGRQANVL
ncbi:MAG: arsenate reductase (azurin) small subunit [Burkholderiales bacterium]|jgi:arsenite oxidase small subunit|nr:arsenate reductase (azurin) small subunit [Burkholderiales bacterium]